MGGINKGRRPPLSREELKGVTWDYFKREPFAGRVITPQNRNSIIKEKYLEYLSKSESHGKEGDVNDRQEERIAYIEARNYVNFEKKHERAYLKGKNAFTFHGEKRLVLTLDRVERLKENLAEIEERYKEGDLVFEEE